MFTTWFVLAILAGLFSTLFNTINRTHLKDNRDSATYAWWFECMRAGVFLALATFNFRLQLTLENGLILVMLGLSEFIAVYFFMKMHTFVALSVSSVITQARVILVPLMAFVLIGERLEMNQYLGIVLLLVGLLLSVSKLEMSNKKKGLIYAVIFSLVSAFSSVLTKYASGFASVPVVMLAFSLPSVVLFPFLMKSPFERLRKYVGNHAKTSIYAAGANVMTLLLLGFAYAQGTVSQITAIFLSMFVVNVVVGKYALHEKLRVRQVIGISIVLVAIFLIQ